MAAYPGVGDRPTYPLTKMAGTFFFQLTAQNVAPEKMQVVSFHPGSIYSPGWESVGLKIPPELFDSGECLRLCILKMFGCIFSFEC